LGHGRRDQALNLAMLILGIVLAVTLVGVFVASCILHFSAMGSLQCDAQGNRCAPTFFSLPWMALGTWFIAVALYWVVRARRLRHIEVSSRVWFRYRTWLATTTLYYLRQPGVTSEAASAALARFSSIPTVPSARGFFLGMLAMMPYSVLMSASIALSAWLQLHWVPS